MVQFIMNVVPSFNCTLLQTHNLVASNALYVSKVNYFSKVSSVSQDSLYADKVLCFSHQFTFALQ